MIPFTESLRHQYALTPDSLVVEIGTYTGGFAKTMAEKYGCRVLTFEPVGRFYDQAMLNFMLPPLSKLVRVENCGVSDVAREESFGIHGELTGFAAGGEREAVKLIGVDDLMRHPWMTGRVADVLSLNPEGEEYAILEGLLDRGLMGFFTHLQFQTHSVTLGHRKRRDAIRNRLMITHRPSWELPDGFDNVWEGWEATA